MQRRATGRPARLCNLRISAPRPANLSPPPWGSGIVRAPVRAGRFREACRKWGQEAVSDLWSGDRHYVSQASVVKLGRGNPHGSLLRTRKYRRRAPRGCLKKSKAVAGRRPPPVLFEIDRGAVRGRGMGRVSGHNVAARTRGRLGSRWPSAVLPRDMAARNGEATTAVASSPLHEDRDPTKKGRRSDPFREFSCRGSF